MSIASFAATLWTTMLVLESRSPFKIPWKGSTTRHQSLALMVCIILLAFLVSHNSSTVSYLKSICLCVCVYIFWMCFSSLFFWYDLCCAPERFGDGDASGLDLDEVCHMIDAITMFLVCHYVLDDCTCSRLIVVKLILFVNAQLILWEME